MHNRRAAAVVHRNLCCAKAAEAAEAEAGFARWCRRRRRCRRRRAWRARWRRRGGGGASVEEATCSGYGRFSAWHTPGRRCRGDDADRGQQQGVPPTMRCSGRSNCLMRDELTSMGGLRECGVGWRPRDGEAVEFGRAKAGAGRRVRRGWSSATSSRSMRMRCDSHQTTGGRTAAPDHPRSRLTR